MKKGFKRVFALGLAMMFSLMGFSDTALAADGLSGGSAAPLTKRVRVPESMTAPAITYEFSFTPKADNEGVMSPAINNDNSSATENKLTLDFSGTGITNGGPDADGYIYYEKKIDNILADTKFTHAGVYNYTVEEIAGSPSISNGTMTYSPAIYEMRVYVINNNTGVEITNVGFTIIKDNTGKDLVENDPEPANQPYKADLLFINTLTKDANLEITKEVSGNYADKTKDFEFKLTLNKGPGVSDNQKYKAKRLGADGNVITPILEFQVGTESSFNLKHGEKLVFENDATNGTTALPIGTTYVLKETKSTNYIGSVKVTTGNDNNEQTETGTAKDIDVIIGDTTTTNAELKSPILIRDISPNKAEWTNTYADPPTPTGILLNSLPFILIMLIGIGGFVGYLVVKRRKLSR